MLKRNIAVLMIAGGLMGAQVNLAAAHEADFSTGNGAARVAHLDGRAAHDVYAGGYGESSGSRGTDSSPFPESNSKD